MAQETLAGFITRHRFRPWDIIPNATSGTSRQHYEFLRLFPSDQVLRVLFDKGLINLSRAFCLAQYMAENATEEPDEFARLVSSVDDEVWAFALTFSPYHKVSAALQNLKLVESAMLEAGLSLNSAMAGMESAMAFPGSDTRSYEREASKATINLLNYSALYASYVDVCRRIRQYMGLKGSPAYNRAIMRIINTNSGTHEFVKGIRNFMLHYHLVEPQVVVHQSEERTVSLLLEADKLTRDGFEWSVGARTFLNENRKIDIISITNSISRDVSRLIEFHYKMVDKRLKKEKDAYEWYKYERNKLDHLSRSMSNIEAIFKMRPRPILAKVLDQKIIENVLFSSLSDAKVRLILNDLANRHKNLPSDMKPAIDREISKLLSKRVRFPTTKAYMSGQPFPRKKAKGSRSRNR